MAEVRGVDFAVVADLVEDDIEPAGVQLPTAGCGGGGSPQPVEGSWAGLVSDLRVDQCE
jgi:hypothetical protein